MLVESQLRIESSLKQDTIALLKGMKNTYVNKEGKERGREGGIIDYNYLLAPPTYILHSDLLSTIEGPASCEGVQVPEDRVS